MGSRSIKNQGLDKNAFDLDCFGIITRVEIINVIRKIPQKVICPVKQGQYLRLFKKSLFVTETGFINLLLLVYFCSLYLRTVFIDLGFVYY